MQNNVERYDMSEGSVMSGYITESKYNKIVSVKILGCSAFLGQRVVSNGRMVPKWKGGVVVEIVEPYENGRSSDCIGVLWDGEPNTSWMKFKDLV